MPEGIIYKLTEQFARDVKNMNRAASSELVRAYGGIWKNLNAKIQQIATDYEKSGATNPQIWLNEQNRLRLLKAQVEAELRRFANTASQVTYVTQKDVINAAIDHTEQSIQAMAKQAGLSLYWNRIDPFVMQQMVGVLTQGSPLDKLLRSYGDIAADSMGKKLLNGLTMGVGPRQIARDIRLDMAGDLNRALRVSRTEIIRAKREATRLSYQENPDLVSEYIRRSSRSATTCSACWAMDGERYPLDTPLDDHPNGNCYDVPYMPELDKFYDHADTGTAAFEKLSEDEKKSVLGQVKYEGYSRGLFGINDLVTHYHSDEWGDSIGEASLKSVLGAEGAHDLWLEVLHPQEVEE